MLNPQQTAAVKYIDGPLLVLAGAGTGKTRVITQKIAYLIETCGYKPQNVCAVTFTNKAANEMRERLLTTLPANARRGLKIATFHTLGLTILKSDVQLAGLKSGFSIFDSEDCAQVIRGILPPGRLYEREELTRIQQLISRFKNDLLTPDEVLRQSWNLPMEAEAAMVYGKYQRVLQAYNAVDFDDLIQLPVKLLRAHESVRERWQNKIRHLLIDEYQDSNTCQYILMQLLVGKRAALTVVGDDDQSVYAWRGARPENLAQLQQDYPQLNIIKLEQNYRSTVRILQAANHLIAHNSHLFTKKLWSELGYGDVIKVISCKDEQDEAEQVVADIISHKLRNRYNFSDYAILYRGNHQSRVFEKVLRDHGISYHLSGGQSWFSRTEVKDVFAYLKLLSNAADDASFLRVINTPKRGIGETSLEALGHHANAQDKSLYTCSDHLALTQWIADKPREALSRFKQWLEGVKLRCKLEPVFDVLKDMVEESGYEAYIYEQCDTPLKAQKRMENVWELLEWVGKLLHKRPEQELSDVVNKMILLDILEQNESADIDTLQLMTLHASKGLEFPFVYLTGFEEDILPHRVSMESDQIEEERRLAYVGITRAQKGLCLTLARQRRRGGEFQGCIPSRFLDELPQEVLEWYGKPGEVNEEKSKAMAKDHLAGLKSLLGS